MPGLHLTRKIGEEVILRLGDKEVVIRVESATPHKVQLSFHGDGEVRIHRGEIAPERVSG